MLLCATENFSRITTKATLSYVQGRKAVPAVILCLLEGFLLLPEAEEFLELQVPFLRSKVFFPLRLRTGHCKNSFQIVSASYPVDIFTYCLLHAFLI